MIISRLSRGERVFHGRRDFALMVAATNERPALDQVPQMTSHLTDNLNDRLLASQPVMKRRHHFSLDFCCSRGNE